MNIHEFVNDLKERFEVEIKEYIQSIIRTIVKQISEKHDIPMEDLMNSVEHTLEHSTKKCKKITKQGHRCKYDASIGESFCIKHINLQT